MKSHFGGRPPPPPPPPLFPLPPSFWQRRLEEESSPLRLPPFPLPSFLPNLISHVDVGEKEEKEEEGKAAISGGERKRKEKILPLLFCALCYPAKWDFSPTLFFSILRPGNGATKLRRNCSEGKKKSWGKERVKETFSRKQK